MLYEPATRGYSRHHHCRTHLYRGRFVFSHTNCMCGRYRLSRRKQILDEQFVAISDDAEWNPRYNIAPTQFVPVIRQQDETSSRRLSLVRWGLAPSWAKSSSKATAMINAGCETVATKPAFSDALKFRRCLIPADAFYEWQKVGKEKHPYCFEVNRGDLFSFAGLWETWNDPSGKALETCTILTTSANAVIAPVHDRML
jgi:putative SOS response-associated peptidase YedK